MKKFLGMLMLTVVIVPMSAFAQTPVGEVPINATISEPNMYRMTGEVDHGSTQGNQGTVQASQNRCGLFVRALRAGSRGDDVTELQKHLVSTGVLKMPVGVAYGYYGQATAKAVSEYQVKSGIVAVGTGTVGPITLQAFKKIFCSGSTPGNQGTPINPTSPTLPPPDFQCPKIEGDFNMDGKVNKDDKAIIDAAFNAGGTADCRHGDMDGNKKVDFDDFVRFDKAMNAQGVAGCPPAGAKMGDANLDGVIDSKDYAAINTGYYNHLVGWANGDFDCNNRVDFDDYALIDRGYNTQNVKPALKITAPNGGEKISLGQIFQITNNLKEAGETTTAVGYHLFKSGVRLGSLVPVENSSTATSFSWQVGKYKTDGAEIKTAGVGSDYQIGMTLSSTGVMVDKSDAPFSIENNSNGYQNPVN